MKQAKPSQTIDLTAEDEEKQIVEKKKISGKKRKHRNSDKEETSDPEEPAPKKRKIMSKEISRKIPPNIASEPEEEDKPKKGIIM